MNQHKTLLAFALACLTVAAFVPAVTVLSAVSLTPHSAATRVVIRSDGDTQDVTAALKALHRPDLTVRTEKIHLSPLALLLSVPSLALSLAIVTGITLAIYKRYCRLLGIPAGI